MRILAVETSCDETSASVLEIKRGNFSVLSNVVSSQVKTHAKYGGIVPEVAARKHAENIMPVISEALKIPPRPPFHKGGKGGFKVDAIAVTQRPGLITSLRIGVEAAKTLSYVWKKPLIPVNHVIGHIYANWLSPAGEIRNPKSEIPPNPPLLKGGKGGFIQNLKSKISPFGGSLSLRDISRRDDRGRQIPNIEFPALCLVVSGGHTMLVLMKNHGRFEIIGQTLDDAAGECFDKTAKILGLGYPGGPAIAARAAKYKVEYYSSSEAQAESRSSRQARTVTILPRPMLNSNDFNFSFSGLKTAVLYKTMEFKKTNVAAGFSLRRNDFITAMAAETQNAIVDVLVSKTIKAAKKYNVKTIMLGGGVAANQELRNRFQSVIPTPPTAGEESRGSPANGGTTRALNNRQPKLYIPDISLCTDNAAMIAIAAYFNPKKISWDKIEADPNLTL